MELYSRQTGRVQENTEQCLRKKMRMKGSDWQGVLKLSTKLFSNKVINLAGERIIFSTTDARTTRYRH